MGQDLRRQRARRVPRHARGGAPDDRRARGGRIVIVASNAVLGGIMQGHAIYAVSKFAVVGLTRATALELAPHRIAANLVLPGGVATPGAIASQGPAPEDPASRTPPLGMATARDVGAAVAFFASPAAAAITNQMIAVDGGWTVT